MSTALEKQIARIEEKINARPGGSVSLWIAGLLKSPEENETILTAGAMLILEDVLDLPEPHLWESLTARFAIDSEKENWLSWPNDRLWFVAAQQNLEDENFDTEEGKDALCYMARVYYEVFHREAPLPSDRYKRTRCEDALNRIFIRPMLARACPEIDAYSTATHTAWLQKMLDASEAEEPENSLDSLREYVQGLPPQSQGAR